jgi:hypothetical protein
MFDTKKANFAVLTLRIDTLEVKESRKGEPYGIARAAQAIGEGRLEIPFRLIVTNRLVPSRVRGEAGPEKLDHLIHRSSHSHHQYKCKFSLNCQLILDIYISLSIIKLSLFSE